jgi:hypothetical protein
MFYFIGWVSDEGGAGMYEGSGRWNSGKCKYFIVTVTTFGVLTDSKHPSAEISGFKGAKRGMPATVHRSSGFRTHVQGGRRDKRSRAKRASCREALSFARGGEREEARRS